MRRVVLAEGDLADARRMAIHYLAEIRATGRCAPEALTRHGWSTEQIDRLIPAAEAIAARRPIFLEVSTNPVRQLPIPDA